MGRKPRSTKFGNANGIGDPSVVQTQKTSFYVPFLDSLKSILMKLVAPSATAFLLIVALAQSTSAQDHQKAFESFGELMIGSWTPEEQNNATGPIRHVYSETLDGKFIKADGSQDPAGPWTGFLGIEPASEKLAWWGFFQSGSAGAAYLTEATQNRWRFVGESLGDDGETTREVMIEKLGEGRIRGVVTDTVDGRVSESVDNVWVRAGKPGESIEKPHAWEFLTGDWDFTNSKGLVATVSFETVAGGQASLGHWMTDDGKTAIETVGWNKDKNCLVVSGFGTSGNYWHIEYTEVTADRCSGPSKVVHYDGSYVEGILTIKKVDADTVALYTDGKDENGEAVEVDAQFKRRVH